MPNCPPEHALQAFYNGLIDSEAEIDDLCDHLEICESCQKILDEFSPSEYERKFRDVILQGETLGVEIQQLLDEQLESADDLFQEIAGKVAPPSGVGRNKKDRFEKGTRIGEGHFFKCLKAYDRWHECDVTVKLAKTGYLTSSDHQDQFHLDCQMYSNLSHPNIVPLLDFGYWDEERWFLSTQWVDAKPFDDWLSASQSKLSSALKVVSQVCDAVQFAHDNLVIHRHLDFANVLVTEDHHAWVTDFGFVLDKRYQFDLVEDKKEVTPLLPREFSTLENDKWVDERSDVYSIGKILQHCLEHSIVGDASLARKLEPIATISTQRSRSLRFQSLHELSKAIANSDKSLSYFGN